MTQFETLVQVKCCKGNPKPYVFSMQVLLGNRKTWSTGQSQHRLLSLPAPQWYLHRKKTFKKVRLRVNLTALLTWINTGHLNKWSGGKYKFKLLLLLLLLVVGNQRTSRDHSNDSIEIGPDTEKSPENSRLAVTYSS